MKELIEAVKKQNGHANFSNKDLLFYIIGRVDKINERLDKKLDKRTFF